MRGKQVLLLVGMLMFAVLTMGQDSCSTGDGAGKDKKERNLFGGGGGSDGGGGNGGGGSYGAGDGGSGDDGSGGGGGYNDIYGGGGGSGGGGGGSSASGCEPGYDPCVPSYPPDVDCPDVGQTVTVTGSDPHGLDADSDGSGCE